MFSSKVQRLIFSALTMVYLWSVMDAIMFSESDEMKRRMYSTIVVVGGGLSKFRGAPGWIKYSVWTQMPKQHRFGLETMDVLTQPKV